MKTAFIDREAELEYLEKIWRTNKAELIIVWGRRRVGKTRLLLEYSKNKKTLYLYVFHASKLSLLSFFTKEIKRQLNVSFPPGYVFPDWDAFYQYLYEIAKDEKIIVILDEFQRLADSSPEAIELLQYWWDTLLQKTQIKLFLVGSSIGMVEKIAISGSGPLFGRKTGSLKIKPMGFFDFMKAFSIDDIGKLIEIFSVFGGTPHYFTMVDADKSVEENIIELVAAPYAPLRDEPEQLLRTELRSLSIYMNILEKIAMSKGGVTVGDIASSLNKSRSELYPYLIQLEKMDIVKREKRITDTLKEFRGARFRIADNFIRFWFRFIYSNYPDLETGNYKAVLDHYRREKNDFISQVFEDIIHEYLIKNSGKNIVDALGRGITIPKIYGVGRWWWKDTEIDVCALAKNAIILGEVKWRNKPITKNEVLSLITQKTEVFRKKTSIDKEIMYLIATKTGIEESAKKLLEEIPSIIITPEQLCKTMGR
ncbi:MAG: ATP-binding protein [Candidatus Njordarchaeales archaeon]